MFPLCYLLCCSRRARGTRGAGRPGRTRGPCCPGRTRGAGCTGRAGRPGRTRGPCRACRACNRYQTVVRRTARRPRRRAPIGNIEAAVIEEQISLRIQGRRVELACGAQAGTGGTRRTRRTRHTRDARCARCARCARRACCAGRTRGAGGCGDLWDLFVRLPAKVRGRIRYKFVVDMDLARLVALRLFAHGDKFDEL